MKHRSIIILLSASLTLNTALLGLALPGWHGHEARADVTPAGEDLSLYMGQVQRHTHKLGLAVQAKNKPLAEFYLTEIGETFEIIQKKFPTYEGFQIAALSKAMLDPVKPPLAKALTASTWPAATTAYANYIAACNNCHLAVNHAFVSIAVPTSNPFNQSFSPK